MSHHRHVPKALRSINAGTDRVVFHSIKVWENRVACRSAGDGCPLRMTTCIRNYHVRQVSPLLKICTGALSPVAHAAL